MATQSKDKELVILKKLTAIVLTICTLAVCGTQIYKIEIKKDMHSETLTTVTETVEKFIPQEKIEITEVEIRHELKKLGELVTCSLEYEGKDELSDSKTLWGYDIPGTEHTIDVAYEGVVKVGYEFDDIEIAVDNDNHKIHITLPEPKVICDGVDNETVKTSTETSFLSNIVNPVESDEVTKHLQKIEAKELDKAIREDKIFELAEDSAKKKIIALLQSFEELGYIVEIEP